MAKKTDFDVIPVLKVTPSRAASVEGNFADIEAYLSRRVSEISTMELTEDNLEQVVLIKKEAVGYRRSLQEKVSNLEKLLFKDPQAIFKSKVQSVFTLVAEMEAKADEVLNKKEQERIEGIQQVLDDYKAAFQSQYELTGERLVKVAYKKQYFNKTADEKERKDDLEAQFIALRKEQDTEAASIRLISKTCEGERRLNPAVYIEQLAHKDVSSIIEEIMREKERLKALDEAPQKEPAAPEPIITAEAEDAPEQEAEVEDAKVVIGIPAGLDLNSDFKERTLSKKIEVVYPCDLGDALTELFKSLKPYGIKIRLLKEEAIF